MPNTAAPRAIPLNLPTLFARCPPKKEDRAAGMRIVETTSPCTVEESEPNVVANWGIVVRGPIVPVSSPNKAPPKEISVACWTYFGGWSHDLCILEILKI